MHTILLAEAMSVEAAKDFAKAETAKNRPTLFYDHIPAPSQQGVHIIYQPSLTPEEIVKTTASGMYHTLLVRAKMVLPEANVSIVVRVGTGMNNVTDWAQHKPSRIAMNTPGQNANATAEYSVKALLRLLAPLKLDQATQEILADNLTSRDLSAYFSKEIKGKTIAVIGMGDIGIRVAQILKGIGADVRGWGYTRPNGSQSFSKTDAHMMGIHHAATLEEAFTNAHAATIHVPFNTATDKLVTYALLQRMKLGATIVNAARGPIIDANGLEKAIAEGYIQGFAIDADWFGDADHDPLGPYIAIIKKYGKTNPNLLITPHIGDATQETSYHATMQGLHQAASVFWDKVIYNAQSAIPAGYKDAGIIKPPGIGRVSADEVNATLSADTRKTLETMLALVNKNHELTQEEVEAFLAASNRLVALQQAILGRPLAK